MAHDEDSSQEIADGFSANRRTIVGLGGAAMLGGGIAAMAASSEAGAQPLAVGQGVRGSLEIKRPSGLGPRGMIDNRFPVSFEESVPKSVEVIMGYYKALTQRDLKGMAEYLHFPFATFEGVEPVLVNTPEDLLNRPPPSMSMVLNPQRYTERDSYMKAGSYDVFRGIEVVCSDPVLAVISMSYDRYDANGNKLLRCEGVYSITNNDGRWGIQLMSTIFTPAQMIGLEYPDGVLAAKRLRVDFDLDFQTNNPKHTSRQQAGASASVELNGGEENMAYRAAPVSDYNVLNIYKIKDVKSRLNFTPEGEAGSRAQDRDMNAFYSNYRALFNKAGLGNWGFVYGVNPDTRVLHQTLNKIHLLTGATRFLTTGEEANVNFDVDVITFKEGRWGSSGALCYTAPHDRSNDVLRPK